MKTLSWFIVCLALTQTVIAQTGINVSLSSRGELVYELSAEIFTLKNQHGQKDMSRVFIPRSSLLRSGCSLRSPWLKIGGASADLVVYPRFRIRWWGSLGPDAGEETDILELRIYTQKEEVVHQRFFMHSGQLHKRWVSVLAGGDIYYHGYFSNFFSSLEQAREQNKFLAFGSQRVRSGGKFSLAICNIQPGVELLFDSMLVLAKKETSK